MHFTPLLKKLKIKTKNFQLVNLEPNWAQKEIIQVVDEKYAKREPIRLIVLKARQLGISTLTEALIFNYMFLHERSFGLVVAHEADASEYLLQMSQTYWDLWPFKRLYTPKYVSRKELSWLETGSGMRIDTAGKKTVGRGRTINCLHGSEVAFWERDPESVMGGLRQTIPNVHGSLVMLESTANGVGNYFYNQWNAAVDGETEYEPLFFPWWKHPEYTASAGRISVSLEAKDEEERVLGKLGATDDHLKWRRWAIKNLTHGDINYFCQEYPATPEEAFVSTGTNVFPVAMLKKVYEPREGTRGMLIRDGSRVNFISDPTGPVTIFKSPSVDVEWGKYFIGADPTHTTRGDNACAQVINSMTYDQVATYHGKIDPMSFGEELAKIGTFYNDATISTEVTGPGYATIARLVSLEYPHIWRNRVANKFGAGPYSEALGWATTHKTKEWAVGWLIKLVADQDLTIFDARTFREMMNFVTMPVGYGNAEGEQKGHDDTVMALAIACIGNSTEGPARQYRQDADSPAVTEPEPSWMSWEG